MKKIIFLFFLSVVAVFAHSCSEEESNEFCDLAQSQFGGSSLALGDACDAQGQSACVDENNEIKLFDKCATGTCQFTGVVLGQSLCTVPCASDTDCSSVVPICGPYNTCATNSSGTATAGTCSSCLSSCRGSISCCCGSGCICDSSCTSVCGDA